MSDPTTISTLFGAKTSLGVEMILCYAKTGDAHNYLRMVSNALEGGSSGTSYWMGYQLSTDGGVTFGATVELLRNLDYVLMPFGPCYQPESGRMVVPFLYIPPALGDQQLKLLYLHKVGGDWVVDASVGSSGIVTLNDNTGGWCRDNESRIIRLSSGTYILPTSSIPYVDGVADFYGTCNSGLFRSTDGINWTYIDGTAITYRGMVEPVAVQKMNGDLLVVANTTQGYLMTQTWTNDGQTHGNPVLTGIKSPRCKHDVIRLSNGQLALGWCDSSPQAGSPAIVDKNLPRPNVMVGFSSDDLATVTNLQMVDYDPLASTDAVHQLYETFLAELDGVLRVGYQQVNTATGSAPWPTYSKDAAMSVLFTDVAAPAITAFSMPGTSTNLTVPITTLTATDNVGVTGYLAIDVTDSDVVPLASDSRWSGTAPANVVCTTAGTRTVKAYAKDAAGNVSAAATATVTITLGRWKLPTGAADTAPLKTASGATDTAPIKSNQGGTWQ